MELSRTCAVVLLGVVAWLATPVPAEAAAPDVPLADVVAAKGRVAGAAARSFALLQPQYAATLASEYDALVPEREMKMAELQPQRGVWTFAPADALVAFALANEMTVRGHTLVWHHGLPDWMLALGELSRQEAEAILETHVKTVVSHYKGRVAQWDVVNEAIDDGTSAAPRSSVWARAIGYPRYIDLAFKWAHDADPQAKLYYNDYGTEGLGTKSDAVYELVDGMKRRGVPINGVGMQAHFDLDPPSATSIRSNIRRLAALRLDIAITELDVRLQVPSSPQSLDAQAKVYESVAGACAAEPACKTFVTWGFTDAFSWVPSWKEGYGDALPFDRTYQPKPAYHGIRRGFGEITGSTRTAQAEDAVVAGSGSEQLDGWRMSTNGTLTMRLQTPNAGRHGLSVVAKGSQAGGAYPIMEVSVDGTPVASWIVDAETWRDHRVELPALAPGTHEVTVRFGNDYADAGGDRNLTVDRASLGSTVDAAGAQTRTAGHAIAGGGWRLTQRGSVQNPFASDSTGTHTLRVIARGTRAAGAWPQMLVLVDGAPVARVEVPSDQWAPYDAAIALPAGRHRLGVVFDNDYSDPATGADRNLDIGDLTLLRAGAVTP